MAFLVCLEECPSLRWRSGHNLYGKKQQPGGLHASRPQVLNSAQLEGKTVLVCDVTGAIKYQAAQIITITTWQVCVSP